MMSLITMVQKLPVTWGIKFITYSTYLSVCLSVERPIRPSPPRHQSIHLITALLVEMHIKGINLYLDKNNTQHPLLFLNYIQIAQ